MLRAKLAGKQVDEVHEDALTAIVLSRLSYLPGDRAWSLLFRAIERLPQLPEDARAVMAPLRAASLGAAFSPRLWPWLRHSERDGSVEPDATIVLGDFLLVLEAKRPWCGATQTVEQLRAELGAVRAAEGGRGPFEGGRTRTLVVVMIEPPTSFEAWSRSLEVPVLALRWTDLREAVDEALARGDVAPHERAILEDLAEGLELGGARVVLPMAKIGLDATLGAVSPGFSEVK